MVNVICSRPNSPSFGPLVDPIGALARIRPFNLWLIHLFLVFFTVKARCKVNLILIALALEIV